MVVSKPASGFSDSSTISLEEQGSVQTSIAFLER